MKNLEKISSRRKFMAMGASSAAVLLGGVALSSSTQAAKKFISTNENSITHKNIEEMKTNSLLKVGDTVFTLGYYQAGDEGSNVYQIVADNLNSDDGGSYINLPKIGLKAKAIFPDGIIRAEQFGVVGVSDKGDTSFVHNNTIAMTKAHKTGNVISYGEKYYHFVSLTIPAGGIVGQGTNTVLISSDSSEKNIITYQGITKSNVINQNEKNNPDATFENFSLKVSKKIKKEAGTGIKLANNTAKINYQAQLNNLTISNIPSCIYISSQVASTIKHCDLNNYTCNGIFIESDNTTNGKHNNILNYNKLNTSQPFAKGIHYQGGAITISQNNITGGEIGIELAPLKTHLTATVTENSIAQQTLNSIRLSTKTSIATLNQTQLIISQNNINASNTSGAAINIEPNQNLLAGLSINNNSIRFHGDENSLAAITITNSNAFMVNHNTINCDQGNGYRGIYIAENCNSGVLSSNNVVLPLNGHTLNLSVTTKEV